VRIHLSIDLGFSFFLLYTTAIRELVIQINKSQNNFLLLGNGQWQQDTLRRLVDSPIVNELLVIDPFHKLTESQKITYAPLDLNSYEKILNLAIEKGSRFIVCDTSEYGMKTAAQLRNDLNAPGLGIIETEIFTNKLRMRDLSRSLQDSNFFYIPVTDTKDLDKVPFAKGRFFVLKPKQSYASKGVWKFSTLEEGKAHLLNNIHNGFADNIIESFVSGTEFTVESKIVNGQVFPLAISLKTSFKNNFSVATSLLFEPATDTETNNKLLKLNSDFISKSGLINGITHGEYILGIDGSVSLVEIAARGGGTRIYSKMLKELTGHDIMGHYLNTVSNLEFERPWDSPKWTFALLGFIVFPYGVLEAVNFDEIEFPWLLDLDLNAKFGDLLSSPNNDNERHGYFWVLGNSLSEIRENVEKLTSVLEAHVSGKKVTPKLMFELNELIEPSRTKLNKSISD